MANPTLCTQDEITQLVHEFYGQIQTHPELGPIFTHHVHDWPQHLNTMVSFWSSLLLKTASFTGSPMIKHAALPNLSAHLFEEWLTLFHKTCQQQANQKMADSAWVFAQRIARSLWMGYQIQQQPNHSPLELKIHSTTP